MKTNLSSRFWMSATPIVLCGLIAFTGSAVAQSNSTSAHSSDRQCSNGRTQGSTSRQELPRRNSRSGKSRTKDFQSFHFWNCISTGGFGEGLLQCP
jgi:hypothetical protein